MLRNIPLLMILEMYLTVMEEKYIIKLNKYFLNIRFITVLNINIVIHKAIAMFKCMLYITTFTSHEILTTTQ